MSKEISTNKTINIGDKVKRELEALIVKVPNYEELTEEQRQRVGYYVGEVDLSNIDTIDEFGRKEAEEISNGFDVIIGATRTSDIKIQNEFTELMKTIGPKIEPQEKGGAISRFVRRLSAKPKEMLEDERLRRKSVLGNIQTIQETLEGIRLEIKSNSKKLGIITDTSLEQYSEIQYQIIALEEIKKSIEQQIAEIEASGSTDIRQIDTKLKLQAALKRVERKIGNTYGTGINAASKAIMSRILGEESRELASNYEQDISTLLPELKGIIATSEINESLLNGIRVHDEFVRGINQMIKDESERSKQVVERVQEMSTRGAIDSETARTLANNVIETVSNLQNIQQGASTENDELIKIFEEFRNKLAGQIKQAENEIDKGEER